MPRYARLQVEPLEERLAPAIYYVSNGLDAGAGSLRQAILSANANPATSDTIRFRASVGSQIALTSGTLQITGPVTITGPGASALTVVRSPLASTDFRIFTVDNNAVSAITVSISGLTISGGRSDDGGGVLNNENLTLRNCVVTGNTTVTFGCGGGILSTGGSVSVIGGTVSNNIADCDGGGIAIEAGTGSIQNVIVSGNQAMGDGGGIFIEGSSATITGSTISGNELIGGFGEGGGITIMDGSTVTILGSRILTNSSTGMGGGIDVDDFGSANNVTIRDSLIAFNTAELDGGGVHACGFNGSNVTIQNTTISSNETHFGDGGGIVITVGNVTLLNDTIAANAAATQSQEGSGGGVAVEGFVEGGPVVTLRNTIVANNTAVGNADDTFGDFAANYCLIENPGFGTITGSNNITLTDPLLGALQNNGGPTMTHALLAGSTAINKGDPFFVPPPSTDQRGAGFNRVINGRIDIGAYEFQAASTATTLTSSRNPAPARQVVTFTATVQSTVPGGNIPTGTVTFLVDNVAVATVALVNGIARFSTTTLTVGTHRVVASYNGSTTGDYRFDPSTSAILNQVITGSTVRRWNR